MIIDLFSERKEYRRSKNISDRAKEIYSEMRNAEYFFNEVADSYEIEATIYRLKALEAEYSALIREAKLEKLCGTICFGREQL